MAELPQFVVFQAVKPSVSPHMKTTTWEIHPVWMLFGVSLLAKLFSPLILIINLNLTTRIAPTMGSWHWGHARTRFLGWLAHRKVPPLRAIAWPRGQPIVAVERDVNAILPIYSAYSTCMADIRRPQNVRPIYGGPKTYGQNTAPPVSVWPIFGAQKLHLLLYYYYYHHYYYYFYYYYYYHYYIVLLFLVVGPGALRGAAVGSHMPTGAGSHVCAGTSSHATMIKPVLESAGTGAATVPLALAAKRPRWH